jgi:hypothetical protein
MAPLGLTAILWGNQTSEMVSLAADWTPQLLG